MIPIEVTVNGRKARAHVEARLLLVDLLRERLGLTGTHVGCEHGVCGSCTVIVGDSALRSCLMFAVQAHGEEIHTVEGLADAETLHPLQVAFRAHHALQCGFCTPGILMAAVALLEESPHPTRDEIAEMLAGQLCRCTGYAPIIEAIFEVGQSGDGGDA